jgi:hypothetical protein
MNIELKTVLSKLEEGKRLKLQFPSPREREAFRVAMYKVKREVDEVFLMVDMDYECEVLKFEKSAEGNIATIYLIKRGDIPRKGYDFVIMEEQNLGKESSNEHEQHEQQSPNGHTA